MSGRYVSAKVRRQQDRKQKTELLEVMQQWVADRLGVESSESCCGNRYAGSPSRRGRVSPCVCCKTKCRSCVGRSISDGIDFAGEMQIVALGLDSEGTKHVWGVRGRRWRSRWCLVEFPKHA